MPKVQDPIAIFWFRRDLRLHDNVGLFHALNGEYPVLPLFIFDTNILDDLAESDDARVTFIHDTLRSIHSDLRDVDSSLMVTCGKPEAVFRKIFETYKIRAVYTNRDYEPYAIERDKTIAGMCLEQDISFHAYKDQVIFEHLEVEKQNGGPYTVYTPYMRQWKKQLPDNAFDEVDSSSLLDKCVAFDGDLPSLEDIGFTRSKIEVPSPQLDKGLLDNYSEDRDIPAKDGTTRLGVHLRFGTVSVREAARTVHEDSETLLNELIWREFFMQILYHFPRVVNHNFREKYDALRWRNNEEEFKAWCEGRTGYPIIDAGMRQLNQTGYMHNRVRMIVASFLCKHLLIDWRWGEAYFARRLLDYELASNNGNWQWAAGTGCDAAPYFRIFNPWTQAEKYDSDNEYIEKWVPEYQSEDYPEPMVKHKKGRERALERYGEV